MPTNPFDWIWLIGTKPVFYILWVPLVFRITYLLKQLMAEIYWLRHYEEIWP